MNSNQAWARYEELNLAFYGDSLTSSERIELQSLRTQFNHAPTDDELAMSAICLAAIDPQHPIPSHLREKILRDGQDLTGPA